MDTLLLDKTGTITMGNRRATRSCRLGDLAADGGRPPGCPGLGRRSDAGGQEHRRAVSPTARGSRRRWRRCRPGARFVEFTAQTRMSGIDLPDGRQSSARARPTPSSATCSSRAARCRRGLQEQVDASPAQGATPLLVCEGNRIAGLVVLEDILKPGISERFERLRRMGLRTVMVTGDNPLTAKHIAEQGRRR